MSSFERILSHAGIELPFKPWRTVRTRSSSVGTLPVSVEWILYRPLVKSRGRGTSVIDAGPSPFPLVPWHSTQWAS